MRILSLRALLGVAPCCRIMAPTVPRLSLNRRDFPAGHLRPMQVINGVTYLGRDHRQKASLSKCVRSMNTRNPDSSR